MTTTRNRRRTFPWQIVLTTAVAALAAMPAPAAAQAAATDEVTFTRDIAPILQRSCQKCHQPNSLAPMSLIDYAEVRPWARAIKLRTGLRDKPGVMPPWYIEKDIGIQRFKDDPSLSDDEIALIVRWADNGAPRGDPADLPPPVAFIDVDQWEIGQPDLIVSSPSFEVAGDAPDWWGSIGEVPTGLAEDRYVSAMEYKEVTESSEGEVRETVGGLFVVHHATLGVTDPSPDPDEVDPLAAQRRWPTHEVGRNADVFDPEAGKIMKAGSKLQFNSMHPSRERGGHAGPPEGRLQVPSPRLRADPQVGAHVVRQRGRPRHRGDGPRPADGGVLHAAGEHADHDLRAAHARAGRADVPRRHLGAPRPDPELRRLRPQLGAGLQLRGRRGAAAAEGHHPPDDRLLQQLAPRTPTCPTRATGRAADTARSTRCSST